MSYLYAVGSERWKKFKGDGDVRGYRAPKGWEVTAELRDGHPITGKQFTRAQWWLCERFTGALR